MIFLSSLMKNVKGNFILQDSLIYQPSLPRAHLFTDKHYRFWTHYSSRARLHIQKQIMRLRLRTLICYVSFKTNSSSRRLLLLLPALVICYTNYPWLPDMMHNHTLKFISNDYASLVQERSIWAMLFGVQDISPFLMGPNSPINSS